MTIVLPNNYHAKNALVQSRIHCIEKEKAIREDIRALRIGILNIMPQAETYEFSLLHPLGRSILQIKPVWIKLKNHKYNSSSHKHLDDLYVTFEEAIQKEELDGLILTGAPVETIPFEEVNYWQELTDILTYAKINIVATMGICWGGMAMAKFLGIDKYIYPKKKFGVFKIKNLDRTHRITGELDDQFYCPQSSHAGIKPEVLEVERDKGKIRLLAQCEDGEYSIFESYDSRFIMHLGHPEYEPYRLVEEYIRDMEKGRKDVQKPKNLDLKNPLNIWRGHRTEFFSQWIKYIHEMT